MDGFETLSRETARGAAPGRAAAHAAGRLRRWGVPLSLLACVGLPALGAAIYEYGMAADQYVSSCAFIVREQAPQMASPNSLSSALAGGNPMLALIEDSEVVVHYIRSGQMLADLPPDVSLERIYATPRADYFTRLRPRLPPEKQLPYWRDMVQPSFDLSSGIITVQVRAFSPQDAALVTRTVLNAAQSLVDRLSQTARQNALDYATQTADAGQARLEQDETALAGYRNRYAVLFPELNAEQDNTVGGNLQLALAQDQASLTALRAQGQTGTSPQVQTLVARIAAEQAQRKAVEAQLAVENGGKLLPLASVLSGYDNLVEDEKLDEQIYASELEALQNARNMAAERSLYLESFVQPAVPVASTYPVRWLVIVETALAGFIAWILAMLTANIIRDQLD